MTVVSSLVIEMAANVARLQQDMDRARKTVESATGSMAKAANTAMNALKGLATGVAAASFGNFISSTAQANKELAQFAMLSGMAIKDFQQISLASTRFGVSQEKLADILKDTQDKVGDFVQTGGGGMADFFERVAPKVGVTAEQFRKLNGKDALQLYVSSLEKPTCLSPTWFSSWKPLPATAHCCCPCCKKTARPWPNWPRRPTPLACRWTMEPFVPPKSYQIGWPTWATSPKALAKPSTATFCPGWWP
jgi:hypothetical protein